MNPQHVGLSDHLNWPECLRDFGLDVAFGFALSSPLEGHWTTVNGWRMHARSSSRAGAPRALLIHGMVISSLYMIPLAEQLAVAGFEAHAVDLPGYGRSEKPRRPLGVPALADAVASWMDLRGGGSWHVVGNSFGCQVAAELAVRRPHCVETLTLIGMTIDPAAPTLWQQTLRLLRDMPREPLRLWMNHMVDYIRAGPRFAIGAMRSMMAHKIEKKLPLVAAPTLIIRGEHDPITPRSWTSAAMGMLPVASFVEIPNGSHAVHYAAPEAVCEAMVDFIAQHAPRADALHPGVSSSSPTPMASPQITRNPD